MASRRLYDAVQLSSTGSDTASFCFVREAELPAIERCNRCGGQVLRFYGEKACLQCGYNSDEGQDHVLEMADVLPAAPRVGQNRRAERWTRPGEMQTV